MCSKPPGGEWWIPVPLSSPAHLPPVRIESAPPYRLVPVPGPIAIAATGSTLTDDALGSGPAHQLLPCAYSTARPPWAKGVASWKSLLRQLPRK